MLCDRGMVGVGGRLIFDNAFRLLLEDRKRTTNGNKHNHK